MTHLLVEEGSFKFVGYYCAFAESIDFAVLAAEYVPEKYVVLRRLYKNPHFEQKHC